MDNLKLCPFCGGAVEREYNGLEEPEIACHTCGYSIAFDYYDTRPLESKLESENASLKMENCAMKKMEKYRNECSSDPDIREEKIKHLEAEHTRLFDDNIAWESTCNNLEMKLELYQEAFRIACGTPPQPQWGRYITEAERQIVERKIVERKNKGHRIKEV